MASEAKQLVVVLGATGFQGASVIDYLVREGKYRVRAVTRNPNSDKAKALKARGVEVVQADLHVKDQIEKALQGAWGLFAVTNFWEPEVAFKDVTLEEKQGRQIADAAVAAKVKFIVYSSLHDANSISKGRHPMVHFSGKNRVEQYIRSLPIQSAFVYLGQYAQNVLLFPPFSFHVAADGVHELNLALRADIQVPYVDVTDTGMVVVQMFNHPDQWATKRVLVASEYLSPLQVVEIYQKVTGHRARFAPADPEALKKAGAPSEILETFQWWNEFGYYAGESLEETRRLFPRLGTWEQFMRTSKYEAKPNK